MRTAALLLALAACSRSQPQASQPGAQADSELSNRAGATDAPNASTLKLTSLSPHTGDADGGTYVRIAGAGFMTDSRTTTVYFGSRQGRIVQFVSDGELIVEAPGGNVGDTVDVRLIFEPGGELKLPKTFKFVTGYAHP